MPRAGSAAAHPARLSPGELNYRRSRHWSERQSRFCGFVDWRRHLYRRFKSREKRFSGMGNLPACFIAENKCLSKDIEARGARCQARRPIGPV